jgi:23S rRNA (uracil1939-C5)-methyltransferase
MSQEITLKIEKLAGLGDGMGTFDCKKVFVPYTLPGDVVRAVIKRDTSDAAYASLQTVITPGKGRVPAVCRHFGSCGGCSLQHVAKGQYREFKQQMAQHAVRKAGFDPALVRPILCMPADSRRRIEMKLEKGKLGYYAQYTHRLVDVEECPVLEPALEALVLAIKKQLVWLPDVTGIQINGVDEGYDVVVICRDATSVMLEPHAAMRRLSLRNADGVKTVFSHDPVTVTLGGIPVEVPPQAFLQTSRAALEAMTQWVLEAVKGKSRILDLFAGIGTYSIPLATTAKVMAMEGEQAMVDAMRKAILSHDLTRLTAEQRDLFAQPMTAEALAQFDAVVINPPRTGAKAQCEQIAASAVPTVAMVSCNPATFARDARILKEGGYTLLHATPIDQFVYSSHLEILAVFEKEIIS